MFILVEIHRENFVNDFGDVKDMKKVEALYHTLRPYVLRYEIACSLVCLVGFCCGCNSFVMQAHEDRRGEGVAIERGGDHRGGADVDSEEILSGDVREEPQVSAKIVIVEFAVVCFVFGFSVISHCPWFVFYVQAPVHSLFQEQLAQHRHAIQKGLHWHRAPLISHDNWLLQICCHPYLLKGAEATEAAHCKTQDEVP